MKLSNPQPCGRRLKHSAYKLGSLKEETSPTFHFFASHPRNTFCLNNGLKMELEIPV